jgi:hypothetical protein
MHASDYQYPEAVHKGLAVQVSAKQFSVACTTLQRHLDHHKKSGNEQFFYSKNV